MRPEVNYPRTLIVNAHFTERSGSGTFLGRLFSGWPSDRLATVDGDAQNLNWHRCERHYLTGNLEFRLVKPFNQLVPAKLSGPVLPPATVTAPSSGVPTNVSFSRRLSQYPWRTFNRLLGGGEILYRVEPSPQLLAWIREFQPEVIYGHFSNLNSLRFLRRVQQELNLPLILHFMDDFPGSYYREGWGSRFVRLRYLDEFAELVRSADIAIAINQEMAEEYEKRYQRPFLFLPMPVELASYQSTARTQWVTGQPFRLLYGGRVGWAIHESLADIAIAVHSLRKDGADVVFDIMTFQIEEVPAFSIESDGVNVQTPGPLSDLARLQAEVDVLVICYDFDPESFRQARYSMPAKLAPCMASGTPILVYGPPGLPVVEYARRDGWGKVVDKRDPVTLKTAVRELMESSTLREQLGLISKKLATERHDAKLVSEEMRRILTVTAGNLAKATGNV